jgi:hypothetical protein
LSGDCWIIPAARAPEVRASKLLVPDPMACSFSSEQLPFSIMFYMARSPYSSSDLVECL